MTATATTISFIGALSGETTGIPVSITATSTPGTTVHTFSGAGSDIIELWATNQSSAAVLLTVEWGNATTTNGLVQYIPAYSTVLVADRMALGTGTVKAFAATTAVIACFGKYWNAA